MAPPAPGRATRFTRLAVAAAAACGLAPPLLGQAQGTLGIGASVVRYDGFLTSGAAVLLPTVRFDSPRLSLAAQGNLTLFESGNDVIQGTAGAAWLAGSARRWRLELSASGGASRYAAEPGSGHVLAGARLHVFGEQAGGWLGATAGHTSGAGGASPMAVTAAGWSVRRNVALVGSVTATWLGSERWVDVLGALRWTGTRLEVEARAGTRPWSRSPGDVGDATTGAFGEVTAHVPLTGRVALALGGGTYPSDPARRVLGATYFNVGLRLRAFGAAAPTDPSLDPGRLRRAAPAEGAAARLEIGAEAGGLRVIRVHAPGARAVELMGDFTDWTVVALAPVAPGVWEAQLVLAPGVHRLNLRLDGGPWLVPAGARAEPGEFGGAVGVVVVR